MDLSKLKAAPGSRRKRKRVGRGDGSGHGTYSTRGQKGQKSRSGGGVRPGFEGGQLSIIKRMPRLRGFTNPNRVEYTPVKVGQLKRFALEEEVTPERLKEAGLIKSARKPVKILGDGDLSHPLVVRAHGFSATAREKIEAVGGRVEVIARA